jgi:hypothetical protein
MMITGLSLSANSWRGINQTPAVATAVVKKKRRRETPEFRSSSMAIVFFSVSFR